MIKKKVDKNKKTITKTTNENKELDGAIRTLAKGSVIVLFGLTLSKFLTYLWTLIIARSGASILGGFSIGSSFLSLGETVAVLGIPAGLYRLLPEFSVKNEVDKLHQTIFTSYFVILITSGIISLTLILLSSWISFRYFPNIKGISAVIDVFALGIPFVVLLDITAAVMHGLKHVEYEAITRNIIENLLKIVGIGSAIFFGLGIIGLSALYVVAEAISVVIALYLLNKYVHKIEIDKKHIKNEGIFDRILFYSLPILIATPFFTVINNADILFLGHYTNAPLTGIYAAVSQTVLIMLLVPGIVAKLNQQVQVELKEKKNLKQMNQIMNFITKWIFILNFPILVVFAIFSKLILSILYGNQYVIGNYTFIILLFSFLIFTLASYAFDALEVYDKPKFILINTGISAFLDIVLCYILVPRLGLIGAGIATGASMAALGLLAQYEVYALTGFQPFDKPFLKLILAGIIPSVILYLFVNTFTQFNGIYWTVLQTLVYGVLYAISLLTFRIVDKTDLIAVDIVEKKIGTKLLSKLLNN